MKNREQGKSETGKTGNVRVFFALWPDEVVRAALYKLAQRQQEACGGRIMRAETLHLTLLFLGDIPAERLVELQQATMAVRGSRFCLELDHFAGWRHNAIGYASPCKVPDALPELVGQLREQAAKAGCGFDRKTFKPHVTLLRNLERMPQMQAVSLPAWHADEFVLVKSALDPTGARYEIVGRWPL